MQGPEKAEKQGHFAPSPIPVQALSLGLNHWDWVLMLEMKRVASKPDLLFLNFILFWAPYYKEYIFGASDLGHKRLGVI